MPELMPSWEMQAGEGAGNPFDKSGAPEPALTDEVDEASVIAFLKARGKTDEEIDQILGGDAMKAKPPAPKPLFNGDRQGQEPSPPAME